jgi:endoglucanase
MLAVLPVAVVAHLALAKAGHRAVAGPPVRRGAPKISGRPVVGKLLTASRGHWSGASSFSFRWKRCNARGEACKRISGRRTLTAGGHAPGTASRHRIIAADLGHRLRVTVIARDRHGRTTATSRATAVIRRRSARTGTTPGSTTTTTTTPTTPTGPAAPGLHVAGNRLLDAGGGQVVLHGVDQSGTEYECSQGYGIFDNGAQSLAASASDASALSVMPSWHINSVFIGLNEDCWLGINGGGIGNWSSDSGQRYIAAIKGAVAAAESHGIYPVIGFFWGDPGTEVPNGRDPNGGGQPPMPDNSHAPLFWEEVADTFKDDPNVIFRLQEEPHPANNNTNLAAWKCWSQGDVQYDAGSDNSYGVAPSPVSSVSHCSEKATNGTSAYATVGMQSLVDIIRGTGADNVIQLPGLAYANMAACTSTGSPARCGMLDSTDGVRVTDPLSSPQLMADFDMYPDAGQDCDTTTCYDDTLAPVAAVMPVDLGEIGAANGRDTQANVLLDWMDGRGQSYYAWTWDIWSDLIASYNGAAASPWGTSYRSRLLAAG